MYNICDVVYKKCPKVSTCHFPSVLFPSEDIFIPVEFTSPLPLLLLTVALTVNHRYQIVAYYCTSVKLTGTVNANSGDQSLLKRAEITGKVSLKFSTIEKEINSRPPPVSDASIPVQGCIGFLAFDDCAALIFLSHRFASSEKKCPLVLPLVQNMAVCIILWIDLFDTFTVYSNKT